MSTSPLGESSVREGAKNVLATTGIEYNKLTTIKVGSSLGEVAVVVGVNDTSTGTSIEMQEQLDKVAVVSEVSTNKLVDGVVVAMEDGGVGTRARLVVEVTSKSGNVNPVTALALGKHVVEEVTKVTYKGSYASSPSDNAITEDETRSKEHVAEYESSTTGFDRGMIRANGAVSGPVNEARCGDTGSVVVLGMGSQEARRTTDCSGGGALQGSGIGGCDAKEQAGGRTTSTESKVSEVDLTIKATGTAGKLFVLLASKETTKSRLMPIKFAAVRPSGGDRSSSKGLRSYPVDISEDVVVQSAQSSCGSDPVVVLVLDHKVTVVVESVKHVFRQKHACGSHLGGSSRHEGTSSVEKAAGYAHLNTRIGDHSSKNAEQLEGYRHTDTGEDHPIDGTLYFTTDMCSCAQCSKKEVQDELAVVTASDRATGHGLNVDFVGVSVVVAKEVCESVNGRYTIPTVLTRGMDGDPQNCVEQQCRSEDVGATASGSNVQVGTSVVETTRLSRRRNPLDEWN